MLANLMERQVEADWFRNVWASMPRSERKWSEEFGDDFAFETLCNGIPSEYPPGHVLKVHLLRERYVRGFGLFPPNDWHGSDRLEDGQKLDSGKFVGVSSFGAIVATSGDSRHRYAIWTGLPRGDGRKVLYVVSHTGFRDSFVSDMELAELRIHAQAEKFSWMSVVGLYTARSADGRYQEGVSPVTAYSLMYLRWLARSVDRVVLAWSDCELLCRGADVLWMLNRTPATVATLLAADIADVRAANRSGRVVGLYPFSCKKALSRYRLSQAEDEMATELVDEDFAVEGGGDG